MAVNLKFNDGYLAYVAGDGNYGVGTVVTFDYDDFADVYPEVFDKLDEMSDSSRVEFILTILNQDEEYLRELGEELDIDVYTLIISKW